MTRSLIPCLLLILLGCSDAALPPENCEPPLPATDDDGAPWPTYGSADAMLADCQQFPGYARRRGSCSDGKRFLEASGGYEGETRYFRDDTLVGVRRWTDVIVSCNEYLFGDAQCAEVDVLAVSCS